MTEQTQEQKKKKEKEKQIQETIQKVKEILKQLHLNTFYKYREAGKEIIASGYAKGTWRSKEKQRAIEEWAISQQTFYIMVDIGKLTETEFSNAIRNFPSVYAWANRPRQQSEIVFPPLPEGKFRTIIVDPPWPMKKILRIERPNQEEELDYSTLNIQQIMTDLGGKVTEKVADDCHVYLWTTQKFLPYAFDIFKAWGVRYECLLTWIKNVGFTPFSWMYSTEHVLFGRIGSLELLKKGERLDFYADVQEHSRKPVKFYELVKRVSPAPRLEMFAREAHDGFEAWGNEVTKFNVPRV